MRYRPSRGLYRRTALAAVGLVALTCPIWSQWVPLHVWRQPEAGPLGIALLYALFAWVFVFGITLWAYLAVSRADSRQLLLASLNASAPALWFSPAVLLLSTLTPTAMAFGLLLVANTAGCWFPVDHRKGVRPPR